MISRRSLFGMLATLPVVGKVFADAPAPEGWHKLYPTEVGPPVGANLAAVRDYLRPGLWAWAQQHGFEADILIEYVTDNLLVIAKLPSDGPLGFCITRAAIQDGLYLKEFGPTLEVLRMQLDAQALASYPVMTDPSHCHTIKIRTIKT